MKKTSEFALAGGGFADIYMGKYAGRDVALKVLRVFEGEEERKNQKVCLLNPVLTNTKCKVDFFVGNLTRSVVLEAFGAFAYHAVLRSDV